jgi:shikimate kinase
MSVILFGFKGCGKTHFGALLSRSLCCPFIDTDVLLCGLHRESALSVRAVHQEVGEAAFRDLETRAVLTLTARPPAVIALGGGTVCNPVNVAHLHTVGRFVYLKVSENTALMRALKSGTPSFARTEDPESTLRALYRKRAALYEAIPALRIDADLLGEEAILHALRQEFSYGL